MSTLATEQKTILQLLSDPKNFFLIPDYQRPYAWESEKECQELWDDIKEFAFPEDARLTSQSEIARNTGRIADSPAPHKNPSPFGYGRVMLRVE